ncbi:MAG: hypothetical protein ABSD98_04820 [Candidatus Korobacteraceae bacterium]|jgi:hypothetical protein
MNLRISALVFTLIATGSCFGRSVPLTVATMRTAFTPAQAGSSSGAPVAQQEPSGAVQQSAEPGVVLTQLTRSLDSRKLKPGDSVEAKITTETRWGTGTVIPRGSKVIGHVTQASARAKGDAESALGIVFERIVLKDGQELPLKASIQAVGPPPNFGPPAMEMGNPSSMPAPGMPTPGVPGPMGGTTDRTGLGPPPGNFPSNPSSPSSGGQSTPTQGRRQNSGELTEHSTGVVGLRDLQLGQDSTLSSSGKEVKLAGGSQVVLRVQNQ